MNYALCNELFGGMEPGEAARLVNEAGCDGIEFAPYTVFGSFSPADVRAGLGNIKKTLRDNALEFAGFHWLLVDSRPLSLVSPDRALRQPALDRLRLLLSAAGEMGGGPLILGSPKQRGSVPGQTAEEAKKYLLESLVSLGDFAVSRNSRILLEALDHNQCDTVNTLEESLEMVKAAGSPGISAMFDFHNTGDEKESWDALIRRYRDIIAHVHINEMNGDVPGSGSSDYVPAFKALKEISFNGWVSVEIFNQPENPARVIGGAVAFMRGIEAA
ncbi:MAG: sugar phosphate isomerase/epimerase [Treponema sp.]|jgi:sugar phosphate isomerase/epimerase|nr:sugar phosphate isomerase/epimerase [Treponema sp.]